MMQMRWAVPMLLVAGVGLAAPKPVRKVPKTEAECVAEHGRWGRYGEGQLAYCNLPTLDGGRICHANRECEAGCLAPAGTPAGQKTAGYCAYDHDNHGCVTSVRAGEAWLSCD
jgi:hypothetical protein